MSAASKHTALAAASFFLLLALALSSAAGAKTWREHDRGRRDRVPPSAPTNLRATAATPNSVALAWRPSSDNVAVAGYYLYLGEHRVKVSGTSYTAYGLACGQSIDLWLVAFDASGNRSLATTATVSTAACRDLTPPSAPTGFRQQATTQTGAIVAWTASSDNVGVVGYDVYRDLALVTHTSQPTATLGGLTCGSAYQYQVDAYDAAGNHSQRSSVWVQTAACDAPPAADTKPPTPPANLKLAASDPTSVTLAWDASTDDVGVAGYDLYVGGVSRGTVARPGTTLSGLKCGTSYSFAVDAYDEAGNRSGQTSLKASTNPCPGPTADATAPTTPGNLAIASASSTTVGLTWSASSDDVGVAGYHVYRNGTSISSVTQTAATVSGLACGTSYTFAVDAYDAAGNASARAQVTSATAACADLQPPSVPANVNASSRTANSIALTWSPSADDVGVAGYGLYKNGAQASSVTGTAGIFSGLACNTNYTLAVDAYDAAGNRSAKATVMVSTTACADSSAPSAPTALVASNVTQTSLSLSWGASSDNVGVTGYDVFRDGTKMASVGSTSSSQGGLACGTSYDFGVVAFDAAGNRSPQAKLTVSTSACATPQPQPTSAIDTLSDLLAAFEPQWVSPATAGGSGGGGIWQTSTPYGAGFRFVATDQMTTPWDSTCKAVLAVTQPQSSFLGTTQQWAWNLMFPSSGNRDGFPHAWHAGVLWEQHTETVSGNGVALDTTSSSGPRFRFVVWDPKSQNGYDFTDSSQDVQLDRWYALRVQVKWSTGSDGFVKMWLDGAEVVNHAGPTIAAGEHPKLQFGYYSVRQLSNEVLFSGIQRS